MAHLVARFVRVRAHLNWLPACRWRELFGEIYFNFELRIFNFHIFISIVCALARASPARMPKLSPEIPAGCSAKRRATFATQLVGKRAGGRSLELAFAWRFLISWRAAIELANIQANCAPSAI